MAKIVSFRQMHKILIAHYLPAQAGSLLITVLATGCFDVLHPAHKAFLKSAKKQGKVLIVGLESDKRVRELTGKGRPITSWEKKEKNLAMLDPVDFVFPLPESFSNTQDHLKLLQLIKVNVFALSENTPHLAKKKKLIKKVGGRIFIYPFDSRYSTSKLILDK